MLSGGSRRRTPKPPEQASADQDPGSQPVPDPFRNVRSHVDERHRAALWMVFEISERTTVPGDRHHRSIAERAQARKHQSWPSDEALDDERAPVSLKRDPCVARAVVTGIATDESCRIPETHQLPPGPEGEIVAVALPTAFELFRRHPVVTATKLFRVTDVSASEQELPHLIQIAAEYAQRLCDMPPHRGIGRQPGIATLLGSEDRMANRVIIVAKHLCDHGSARARPMVTNTNRPVISVRSIVPRSIQDADRLGTAWEPPPIGGRRQVMALVSGTMVVAAQTNV